MKYILAHDLGTSGNKALLLSEDGSLKGSEVRGYGVRYFNGNWAEQDPGQWWRAVCDSTGALLSRLDVSPKDIAAVSFSGHMMGCLCVDRQGRPLRDAIIWADQRARDQNLRLSEKMDPRELYKRTGHRSSAAFGLPKLMWIRERERGTYRETFRVLNAKDYLVHRLTGVFVTEPSDAAGFNCLDLKTLAWSPQILDAAGIDGEKLPEIRPSHRVAGQVTREAAEACGLLPGTPVVPGGGDGACAGVGAGAVEEGKTYVSLGSSAWIGTCARSPLLDPECRTDCWPHLVPGFYTPIGAMQTAGSAYAWLKDQVCLAETRDAAREGISPYELINRRIEESPPGANGILFLPYLLGERAPRWNPDARGAFIGLKLENSRSDLLRSVLEGVSLNLAVILDIFRAVLPVREVLAVGGGARGAVWRQILADVFGLPVSAPALLEESSALGAAVCGGVGAGLFEDFGAAGSLLREQWTHRPTPGTAQVYARARKLFDACYVALEGVFAAMGR